ncbi:MFS transporter [Bradyrhizobium sp. JYMT SZCCT0180]|uniref:MFS transporter n=1 Tax=Bradyrhizobium sp. JYMT SZCCT0180 TaxID=2807666 RepID=UPI001BA4C310|nr:MFS transporter [Bradyrhizobium sp. JYMT SZCCT0180]MBR1210155.1 MFS transporter [Bradyrhizobium sp. JYMT SZCCT0180]
MVLQSGKTIFRVLVVLAITQVIGWGTIGLLAVVGGQIADDLHMDISAVFAGSSIFYVLMGLCAPVLARPFTQFGARRVMIAGAIIGAPGFVLLSFAHGPIQFFAAWVILGAAGSATLSTAAYIMLNEIAGRDAKRGIGAMMLVTGLSSSVFWPTTSFLSHEVGWRGTCLVYCGMLLLLCLPLYYFGLPRRTERASEAVATALPASASPIVLKSTFYLILVALAFNAFVSFGFSAVLIELLKAEGLSPATAVTFGSMLGVIQVSARGLDFLGGGRWDGITTALFAGSAIPVGMLLLMIGGGSHWAIAAFILLYGMGSGAFAVARATIPLVFYDQAEFAKATSRLALPLNIISAASPPLLVGLLTNFGSNALLGVAMACSCGALLILLRLRKLRPAIRTIAAG